MESDMFLKIEGARMGPIKGEAQDQLHRDEIDVHSWSWGMQGNASATATAGSRTGGSSQVSVTEMMISKGCDRASTSLLAALRSNEQIKRAVLSVRKAGGANPVEYLVITMENARIRSVEMSGTGGMGDQVSERVSISFQKIAIEYRGQDGSGGGNAVSRFETDLRPA